MDGLFGLLHVVTSIAVLVIGVAVVDFVTILLLGSILYDRREGSVQTVFRARSVPFILKSLAFVYLYGILIGVSLETYLSSSPNTLHIVLIVVLTYDIVMATYMIHSMLNPMEGISLSGSNAGMTLRNPLLHLFLLIVMFGISLLTAIREQPLDVPVISSIVTNVFGLTGSSSISWIVAVVGSLILVVIVVVGVLGTFGLVVPGSILGQTLAGGWRSALGLPPSVTEIRSWLEMGAAVGIGSEGDAWEHEPRRIVAFGDDAERGIVTFRWDGADTDARYAYQSRRRIQGARSCWYYIESSDSRVVLGLEAQLLAQAEVQPAAGADSVRPTPPSDGEGSAPAL